MARRFLRAKWCLLRLGVAAVLLWVVAADTPQRLARLQLASLPGFDYAGEVRYLRAAQRYGEALVIADAGLEALPEGEEREALAAERRRTAEEQSSFVRRARDAGLGALSGRGTSLESLVGAVAADFFVVGDVRDLVIEGGRYVLDGETDEVILILSGIGLATTVAPEVDWVPSVLKAARKAGTLGRGLGEYLVRSVRARRMEDLRAFFADVRRLSAHASPGGAVRLLRFADDPADVARMARFVERQPGGAFALHVTGKEGVDLVKASDAAGPAARAAADRAVVLAARRGESGRAWLRTGSWRVLARPHPIVGVLKALYKGNAEALAARIAAALDPRAWWLLPLLAAWVVVEAALLVRRLAPGRVSPSRGSS